MPNVFVVYSYNTYRMYTLLILPIKHTSKYRIVNLTNLYVSSCTFDSIEDAICDIFRYQYNKKNKVITSGLYYNIVKLICSLSKGKFILNNEKEIWY
jgi:hypothetical protein